MTPEGRYWAWTLTIALGIPALVVGLIELLINYKLEGWSWIPQELRGGLLLFIGIGLFVGIFLFGIALRYFFEIYVFPLHRFAEDVEAVLHGHPRVRLDLDDSPELLRSVRGLNELLNRNERQQIYFEERLDRAFLELEEEKNRLESILDTLTEGVVVCTLEGEVIQYNRAFQKSLEASGKYLGVRRTIYEIIDSALIHFGKERIEEEIGTGVEHPSARFISPIGEESSLQFLIKMAPILDSGEHMEGFALTIDSLHEISNAPSAETIIKQAPTLSIKKLEILEDLPLSELRFVVFDTETTGLEPSEGDEIISIAGVAVANGEILENEIFDQLVNPQRPISRASMQIHHITEEMVQSKPTIEKVLKDFSQFIQGAVLVAHNAAFDMKFLKLKEYETGLAFNQPVLDTMLLSAVIHPNQESHSLDSLIKRYGLSPKDRHSALADSFATAELFLKLLAQLEARNIILLKEILEASKKVPLAKITY